MKLRIAAALLACILPGISGAWIELGSRYLGGVTFFQLGDICDSARFPLTPGSCVGDDANPDWRVEAEEAMGRWHAVTGNFQFITDPGQGATTPGDCASDDPNSLFFLDDICGFGDFGESTLAVALTSFFLDGVAIHSDVIFNTAFEWEAFDDAVSNHGDAIDFRRVAVHELGHVAGLGHPYHVHAIMSPFIQETINSPQPDDVAGMSAIYGASLAFAIADQNGNSDVELVHVWRTATGQTLASIRDSGSGEILKDLAFFTTAEFQVVDAVLIPDEDSSGAPELAVLAIRMSDQRPVVQIRNIDGADNPRTVGFSSNLTPIRLKNIGDADGNGVSELAVLAVREADLRAVVEIRNSFGEPQRRTVGFAQFASPLDMDVLVDPLDIDSPRLVVLMAKWADSRGFLDSRDAIGEQNAKTSSLRADNTPISLVLIDDGGPKAAVLSARNDSGRTGVEIKNIIGSGGNSISYWDSGNDAIGIASAGDADGDGNTDLIVLSRRSADGRVVTEVRNSDGSNLRRQTFAGSFDAIGSVFVLADTDGDMFPELAALTSLQSNAKAAVHWRNMAGPNQAAATRIWVSPPP